MKKFAAALICLALLLPAAALAAGAGVQVTVKNVGTVDAEAAISRVGMTESKQTIKK